MIGLQARPRCGVTDDEEDIWLWATEIIGTLFYAFRDGHPEHLPPLEEIRSAVEGLILLAGWKGLEPEVRPVRLALRGPDVRSYAELVRLVEGFLDEVKERLHQKELARQPYVPRDDDLF
ncbi:hypothetical protein [Pseudomonas linyingensis]|uniref:hypothetical protein n=1 Tax=Pseudomonas linyingensis TaxID=915471 RepID=UPI000B7E1717|nr:hypothetical protein [Pseudomonas linyingensis]